jgi:hypothetical protein
MHQIFLGIINGSCLNIFGILLHRMPLAVVARQSSDLKSVGMVFRALSTASSTSCEPHLLMIPALCHVASPQMHRRRRSRVEKPRVAEREGRRGFWVEHLCEWKPSGLPRSSYCRQKDNSALHCTSPIRIETTPLLGRFNPMFKKPGAARRGYGILVRLGGVQIWQEPMRSTWQRGEVAKPASDNAIARSLRAPPQCGHSIGCHGSSSDSGSASRKPWLSSIRALMVSSPTLQLGFIEPKYLTFMNPVGIKCWRKRRMNSMTSRVMVLQVGVIKRPGVDRCFFFRHFGTSQNLWFVHNSGHCRGPGVGRGIRGWWILNRFTLVWP